jgi:hypothetical protein
VRHLVVAVFLMGLLAGCEEPIPEKVTFEPTMRALFASHCVRCHGAGGTLNNDPELTGLPHDDKPSTTYLDQFGDTGDCTIDPMTKLIPMSCRRGALYSASTIKFYSVMAKDTEPTRMPPAPSDPLTDWEKQLVGKWCDNPMP